MLHEIEYNVDRDACDTLSHMCKLKKYTYQCKVRGKMR